MPCYYPVQAWRGRGMTKNGRTSIVFKRNEGFQGSEMSLPCGQCIGCRLERSRQWAVRCVHEASLYDRNCFVTLTYSDDHLPADGSLSVRDFQLFMKRLRKKFGSKIRFFHCGEYGEKNFRPHYHACIFNFDFPDRVFLKEVNGVKIYTSVLLADCWPWGFSTVGDVNFQSAAYVARYVLKKVTGDGADSHYAGKHPEYITMSRRPGIGSGFFDKYMSDMYPRDYVVLNGVKMKPPVYYDKLYSKLHPSKFEDIKYDRIPKGEEARLDNDSFRRPVKEICKKSALKLLKRHKEF